MKKVLTIAGSDSSGGAGIQADIKTITMHGVYAMSALTALTAQNTTGVHAVYEVTEDFLQEQLDAVFSDIFPDAVKIGMVSSAALVRVIAERLRFYGAKRIVVDPVMIATSGSRLIQREAVSVLLSELFPLALVVTPNIAEAEALAGIEIKDKKGMLQAAEKICSEYGCAVLVKGGHSIENADDLLYQTGTYEWIYGERINNPNTHGTGCTLSSAIASNLARGCSLTEAVTRAKAYISDALRARLNLGKGSGPLCHNFLLEESSIAHLYTKKEFDKESGLC